MQNEAHLSMSNDSRRHSLIAITDCRRDNLLDQDNSPLKVIVVYMKQTDALPAWLDYWQLLLKIV